MKEYEKYEVTTTRDWNTDAEKRSSLRWTDLDIDPDIQWTKEKVEEWGDEGSMWNGWV